MAKHKCIYCLEDKEEAEFNREHVIPRMMGTYQNGFVLNNNQVCQECNSYFSRELENPIGLDSLEAFLRMQHGSGMSNGRSLRRDRISLTGNKGIFKGLSFSVIADSTNDERIHFDIFPRIGIHKDIDSNECDYFSIDEMPTATDEVLARLKDKPNGIVTVGLDREVVEPILDAKGYLKNGYKYSESQATDLYAKPDFETTIKFSIDSIVRRVCAKTVFNYLCFSKDKEFVLQSRFDEIRKYIRYGTWSDNLWFRYSQEPVSTAELPNETAHSVGYMLFPQNGQWVLCGCLTWYGRLTYVFKLGITDIAVTRFNVLPSTKMAYFNNEDKTLSQEEAVFVYGGRIGDQYTFGI
jgi:hypothetical protein